MEMMWIRNCEDVNRRLQLDYIQPMEVIDIRSPEYIQWRAFIQFTYSVSAANVALLIVDQMLVATSTLKRPCVLYWLTLEFNIAIIS